jgi:hypothetical protein
MRIDLYTKTILTLIVLLLGVIAFKPVIQPKSVAAEGSLNGVQLSGFGSNLWAVDTRSGDIWVYDIKPGTVSLHRKIVQLGKPLSLDQ